LNNENEILEGPTRHEDKGLATRLTFNEEREKYRVEHSVLLKDGSIDGDWNVFGGVVGCPASEYDTEEAARRFYDKIPEVGKTEIIQEIREGENE
jgi:hypothetical protein